LDVQEEEEESATTGIDFKEVDMLEHLYRLLGVRSEQETK
jgi:hypothetical protein